ncbi:hypothetical protein [Streptomyces silvensis]|uniref:Uncharacterized protein n=1 Tax=Streptomyces silvensis TaxID=1765722 RepID=A0A0W7X3J8_9ACTN|nr:hypothetical protein [Streptomyces silvensis]KUF17363.1 hypothetical protein AT728_16305 [Streptomyces silvensis]
MPKPTTVTCTLCGATAPIPQDRDHRPLWDAGWRWIGSQDLFSCPPCPPVLVVDEHGHHRAGPGLQAASQARGTRESAARSALV